MKKFLFITAAAVCTLATSCSKDESFPKEETPSLPLIETANGSHAINPEEAVRAFENFIDEFNKDEIATRSVGRPRIRNVKGVDVSSYGGEAVRTRSEASAETLMYEISFENSDMTEGFALVVGDDRFSDVIAYVPVGAVADTTQIPAMALFFQEASYVIPAMISQADEWEAFGRPTREYEQAFKTGYMQAVYPPDQVIVRRFSSYAEQLAANLPPYWYGSEIRESLIRRPIVSTRWHQREPYNNLVPVVENGVHAVVGCVPLAIAQVMTVHEKPDTYDWRLLKRGPMITNSSPDAVKNEVGRLLVDVGYATHVQRGINSSGCSPYALRPALIYAFDYNCDEWNNDGRNLDRDVLEDNITIGRPVIVQANCISSNGDRGAHAFIVDGLRYYERYFYCISTTWQGSTWLEGHVKRWTERAVMMHCNFGWTNEQGNGWYFTLITGNIDPGNPTITFPATYRKSIFHNIYPKS